MAKINVLDSSVYNRIAAGEVVERPYSVVKELAENSIDAGAKNIFIEISEGGIASVKVTDDGGGIEKEELKKALLPHATSKIASAEDLDLISTLGFRGEALASIASVSRMKIASKPKSQEFGAEIVCEGGAMGEVTDCGMNDGTEISVNNLFFNTPARRKFLKTAKGEEADISNIVSRFILGNPEVSFRYTSNGKPVYQSYGDGLESAMLAVYGRSTVENCFYIDAERNGIRLSGYIGKHFFSKPNRTYQSMFINGRYVINSTLSSAIANAYGAYLMKRQYPFYVLNLTVPAEIVDVNVHPNKSDVRFSNNQVIYGSVYSIVSKVLDGSSEAVNIVRSEGGEVFPATQKTEETPEKPAEEEKKSAPVANVSVNARSAAPRQSGYNPYELHDHTYAPDLKDILRAAEPSAKARDIFEENKKFLEELYEKPAAPAAEEKKAEPAEPVPATAKPAQQELPIENEFRLIGQALNTYLIFENGKDIFFIDQHAAHERVLFDRFYEKALEGNVAVQTLLVPYVFGVNHTEDAFLKEKTQYFADLGIDLEEFGYNTYKISSLPVEIADMDVKAFMDDCLSDMNFFKKETVPSVIREKIATKACRSAIKSGDPLDEKDIAALLSMLKGNLGLKCPHGRPIAVRISRTEIDKWFKRIV